MLTLLKTSNFLVLFTTLFELPSKWNSCFRALELFEQTKSLHNNLQKGLMITSEKFRLKQMSFVDVRRCLKTITEKLFHM